MVVVLGHEGQPGDGSFHWPVPHHDVERRTRVTALTHINQSDSDGQRSNREQRER